MTVSRSGYYKLLNIKDTLNTCEINRHNLEILIKNIYNKKQNYGYHRINAVIKWDVGLIIWDNLVHKGCKKLNIKSKIKHYKYQKTEESI